MVLYTFLQHLQHICYGKNIFHHFRSKIIEQNKSIYVLLELLCSLVGLHITDSRTPAEKGTALAFLAFGLLMYVVVQD